METRSHRPEPERGPWGWEAGEGKGKPHTARTDVCSPHSLPGNRTHLIADQGLASCGLRSPCLARAGPFMTWSPWRRCKSRDGEQTSHRPKEPSPLKDEGRSGGYARTWGFGAWWTEGPKALPRWAPCSQGAAPTASQRRSPLHAPSPDSARGELFPGYTQPLPGGCQRCAPAVPWPELIPVASPRSGLGNSSPGRDTAPGTFFARRVSQSIQGLEGSRGPGLAGSLQAGVVMHGETLPAHTRPAPRLQRE